MIAFHQANRFGFCSAFEHLIAAAQFQILDQDDAVSVDKHVAVDVFDNARSVGRIGLSFALPFVTAGDAFMSIGVFQNLAHFAHRTSSRFAHEGNSLIQPRAGIQSRADIQ